MCESFFATLECELLDGLEDRKARLRLRVEALLNEDWYNPRHRDSALD